MLLKKGERSLPNNYKSGQGKTNALGLDPCNKDTFEMSYETFIISLNTYNTYEHIGT
jgi:hypothetical protein